MKLLENVPFDITEYCGNLIVTYLSDDRKIVEDLFLKLDSLGYEYIKNEVGRHTVMKNSYIDDIEESLSQCGCYLLYLPKSFDDERNRALRNNIWYQIGMLQARRPGIVVPFMNPDSRTDLSHGPLQKTKVIDYDKIVSTFNERFRSVIARNEYFEDDEMNEYTRDRINYRRLEISLDVTVEDFENAKEMFSYRNDTDDITDDEFIGILRDNMVCGARLLSFGNEGRLTTNLLPYSDEINTIYNKDYPESFSCKHVFVKDGKRKDGKMGEYKLEVILPIHKLLGVNFKTFVGVNKSDKDRGSNCILEIEMIEALFRSNFDENSDLVKIAERECLYFCIPVYDEEKFPIRPELEGKLGSYSDYLYPQ